MAAQPAMLLTQLTRLTMLQVINCGNKWREVRFKYLLRELNPCFWFA